MKKRILTIIGITLAMGLTTSNLAIAEKDSFEKELSEINKLIQVNPSDSNAYLNRARIMRKKGQIIKALDDVNKSIELDNKNTGAYFLRSVITRMNGRLEEALFNSNKLIELTPENAWAYILRATVFQHQGQLDKSQIDYNKAISLNPDPPIFLYHLKNPKFLNIGDTRRLIKDQETLLINDNAKII